MLQLWKEGRLFGDLKHLLAGVGSLGGEQQSDLHKLEESLAEKKLNGAKTTTENGADNSRGSGYPFKGTSGDKVSDQVGQVTAIRKSDQVDQSKKRETKKFKVECCNVM